MTNVNSPAQPSEIKALIDDWSSQSDISARSVLVTIFGDTVLPVTRSLWLSQLFAMTDVFGFTHRLVRTSMYRLAAEDWFINERIGRQSCYHLTDLAIRESEDAGTRIYHATPSDWSGTWSLVLLDNSGLDAAEQDMVAEHLAWHGFITLGRGVLGSPTMSTPEVTSLCDLLKSSVRVPIASATFDDLEGLVDGGFFSNGFKSPEIAQLYESFVARYNPILETAHDANPLDAFALRTMLVHDLRRIRLRYPDIPAQLLPTDWIGDRAEEVAAGLYSDLSATAALALSDVFELDYPTKIPGRFA